MKLIIELAAAFMAGGTVGILLLAILVAASRADAAIRTEGEKWITR